MATQEPNVYCRPRGRRRRPACTPARASSPRSWASCCSGVGEDKMLFGSDYAIWEPKWQVEGFVDWDMPDDEAYDDYPRLGVEGKKKIMGLNAAKLYGIEVPADVHRWPASPRPQEDAAAGRRPRREPARPGLRGSGHGLRPGARRADHHARLRRLLRRATATTSSVRLRLPTPQCAPNFAFLMAADAAAAVPHRRGRATVRVVLEDHYTGEEINAAVNRDEEFAEAFPGETDGRPASAARAVPAQGAAGAPESPARASTSRRRRSASSRGPTRSAAAPCGGRSASTPRTTRPRS